MQRTLTAQLAELARTAPGATDGGAEGGTDGAAHGGAERVQAGAAAGTAAGTAGTRETAETPAHRVLADRRDGTVVALGRVVAKAHPPGTDPGELAARLRTAAHPRLDGILLRPLPLAGHGTGTRTTAPEPTTAPEAPDAAQAADAAEASGTRAAPHIHAAARLPGGRLATLWPRGSAVDPEDETGAPWEEAAALLARLHAVPPGVPGPLPPMRGPAKAARAMARMRAALAGSPPPESPCVSASPPPRQPPERQRDAPAGPALDRLLRAAARAVEHAWSGLPAWCRAETPPPPQHAYGLCHGDFHLGQLVSHTGADGGADTEADGRGNAGGWLLIDVDDLGFGDPAWDLARPAAWYAAGLLPAPVWQRFLRAYAAAGGRDDRDPWPWLDAPARALTVQTAALGIAKAHAAGRPPDEAQQACVDACVRIAATSPAPRPDLAVFQLPSEQGP